MEDDMGKSVVNEVLSEEVVAGIVIREVVKGPAARKKRAAATAAKAVSKAKKTAKQGEGHAGTKSHKGRENTLGTFNPRASRTQKTMNEEAARQVATEAEAHPYFSKVEVSLRKATSVGVAGWEVRATNQFCEWVFLTPEEWATARESVEQVLGPPMSRHLRQRY